MTKRYSSSVLALCLILLALPACHAGQGQDSQSLPSSEPPPPEAEPQAPTRRLELPAGVDRMELRPASGDFPGVLVRDNTSSDSGSFLLEDLRRCLSSLAAVEECPAPEGVSCCPQGPDGHEWEFVLGEDGLYVKGWLWQGTGYDSFYEQCIGILERSGEMHRRVRSAQRVEVFTNLPFGCASALDEPERAELMELLAGAPVVGDSTDAHLLAPWPRPAIRAYAGDEEVSLELLLKGPGVALLCAPEVGCCAVFLPDQLWEWTLERAPQPDLLPDEPECLARAEGVAITRGNDTHRLGGAYAVNIAGVLHEGERVGPCEPASLRGTLTCVFTGVPAGREQVVATGTGFCWNGTWFALEEADQRINLAIAVP